MRAIVLGSAAGGGFPQWNCACANCRAVRAGSLRTTPRTQDSIAVAARGAPHQRERFVLLNASPDVATQIERTPPLQPRRGRETPIAAIVLTNGDLDHALGLFSLREGEPLRVYATASVRAGLEANAMLATLRRRPQQLQLRDLPLDEEIELRGVDDAPTGLRLRAFAVAGKSPLHLAGRASRDDNVGLSIRDPRTRGTILYVPSAAALDVVARETRPLQPDDVLFFDGTFWSSEELLAQGLAERRAEDMAHLPISGDHGSLAGLSRATRARRIYTHVNNTNPILLEDTPERYAVEAAGWEVASDGMEVVA